jgi:hypothetical protein
MTSKTNDRWPEIRRHLTGYNGVWAGDVAWIVQEYGRLRSKHEALVAAVVPLRECEGDMTAVRVPHAMFRGVLEALDG